MNDFTSWTMFNVFWAIPIIMLLVIASKLKDWQNRPQKPLRGRRKYRSKS